MKLYDILASNCGWCDGLGQSLSALASYQGVAERFGLDPVAIGQQIESAWAEGSKLDDVAQLCARCVLGFPRVLLEKDGWFYDLRHGIVSLEELERNYQDLLD